MVEGAAREQPSKAARVMVVFIFADLESVELTWLVDGLEWIWSNVECPRWNQCRSMELMGDGLYEEILHSFGLGQTYLYTSS